MLLCKLPHENKRGMYNVYLDFRGKICEKKVRIIHAGKYGSEQLFTKVEVNRPGYSQSCECSEVDLLGFSLTLR